MRFYKVYAKQKEENNVKYINVESGFETISEDFSIFSAAPLFHLVFFLRKRAFLYFFLLFLVDFMGIIAICSARNINIFLFSGVLSKVLSAGVQYIFIAGFFYFFSEVRVFFQKKYLEKKGFTCIFNAIAKSKRDAQERAMRHLSEAGKIGISI